VYWIAGLVAQERSVLDRTFITFFDEGQIISYSKSHERSLFIFKDRSCEASGPEFQRCDDSPLGFEQELVKCEQLTECNFHKARRLKGKGNGRGRS
jgi:hypothetical protein